MISNYRRRPERAIQIATLLLLLVSEWLFFFRNKEFFHFFGGLGGIKDFRAFKDLGVYGLKPEDFLNLQDSPLLVAVIIGFVFLDVYLVSKIIEER